MSRDSHRKQCSYSSDAKLQKSIILLALLLIPVAYAIENCKDIVEPSDIPCRIVSAWNYTQPCTNHNVLVYNNSGDNVRNYTFASYGTTGLCAFTWNITAKGSYTLRSGVGDVGTILVRLDNMQMSLIIGLGITIAAFLFMAFKLEEQHFFLRLSLIFFSVITIGLIPVVFLVNDISKTFNYLILGFVGVFWIYVFGFIVYLFLIKLGWVVPKDERKP